MKNDDQCAFCNPTTTTIDNFQRMVDCEPFMSADDFADLFINKINKSHLLNRRKEDVSV